jgi:hypothetical protein
VTGVDVFAAIRDEPGNVSVKTIGQETFKLGAIRAAGLPGDLFADVAPKVLAGWRARVAAEAPSHLRSHPHEVMVTLLAAYLYCRHREITDALADLLIATVHRINARADTKVTSDFVAELKRVPGKENILFKMTEAALKSPGERVEDVIYPAVPGGHETLVALLREFKAKGTSYRQHRQRVFKASCTSHYRAGLIQILEVLEFGSTNTVHAPMVEALALIKRYKADVPSRVKCYAPGEHVPVEGIIPAELAELMYRADSKRRQRILRTVYECGVFQALREKLRCKEIWVAGAEKWRNPDLDLPADFEANRAENYAQLRKPLDPRRFTGELREELDAEMSALNDALGGKGLAWLKIAERRNAGAIRLTPLDAAPEPRNLRRLKTAIRARWGVVPLMDMLTETCLRTSCLNVFTPAGTQNHLDPQVLFERLLLLIYAYGTGRAQRSIFLARWLRDRDLQRETESGLNVVENYNGVNDYIRFGKRGELASNRREEQELGMLCLHILQSSLGLINTLMIQDTLALPEWADVLTDADRRGLTPVFHTNMTPYGEIQLRTDRRLDLTGIPPSAT